MRFIMPRFFINCERWKWNDDLRIYVSTHGHFKDEHKRNKACKVKDNYFWVKVNDKWLPAHRVVLLTWRPLPNDGEPMTVDHLNSITRDNRLCNLEWVTREENLRRANKNVLNASRKVTPRNSIQELPFEVPLLSKNLGFDCHDCVPYTNLMGKINNNEVAFRVENTLYTANELYEKFNMVTAQRDNFIKKACSRAFEGKAYNGIYIELIRVK